MSSLARAKRELALEEKRSDAAWTALFSDVENPLKEAEYNIAKAKVEVAKKRVRVEETTTKGRAERLAEARAKVDEISKKGDKESEELKDAQATLKTIEEEDVATEHAKANAELQVVEVKLRDEEDKKKTEEDKLKVKKAEREVENALLEVEKYKPEGRRARLFAARTTLKELKESKKDGDPELEYAKELVAEIESEDTAGLLRLAEERRTGAMERLKVLEKISESGAQAVPLAITARSTFLRDIAFFNVPGKNIAFVQPDEFHDMFASMIQPIYSHIWDMEKNQTVTFVVGASGCGKTRVALELFNKLNEDKAMYRLHRVVRIPIRLHDGVKLKDMAEGDAFLAKELGSLFRLHRAPNLHDALCSIAATIRSSTTERLAFVFHLDEFQTSPTTTACILRALRTFNVDYNNADHAHTLNIALLPVLSGLSSETTTLEVDFRVSGVIPKIFVLLYFASEETSFELFRNAAVAVGFEIFPYSSPSELPFQMECLFEDCYGWPQAIVYLAGVFAWALMPYRGCSNTPDWKKLDLKWDWMEDRYYRGIASMYDRTVLLKNICADKTEVAAAKLFYIAVSPFRVPQTEPINGCTLLDLLEFGIVTFTDKCESTHEVRVRMSLPLLRIINSGKFVPDHILVVNRTSGDFTTLEEVQLHSIRCSINALLLITKETPITPLALRPNAFVPHDRIAKLMKAEGMNAPEAHQGEAASDDGQPQTKIPRSESSLLKQCEENAAMLSSTKIVERNPLKLCRYEPGRVERDYVASDLVTVLPQEGTAGLDSWLFLPLLKKKCVLQAKTIYLGSKDSTFGIREEKEGIKAVIQRLAKSTNDVAYMELITNKRLILESVAVDCLEPHLPCLIIHRDNMTDALGHVFAGIYRHALKFTVLMHEAHADKMQKRAAGAGVVTMEEGEG